MDTVGKRQRNKIIEHHEREENIIRRRARVRTPELYLPTPPAHRAHLASSTYLPQRVHAERAGRENVKKNETPSETPAAVSRGVTTTTEVEVQVNYSKTTRGVGDACLFRVHMTES